MKPTPPERIRLYFSHAKQEWLVSHQCNDTPDKPEYVLASKLNAALAEAANWRSEALLDAKYREELRAQYESRLHQLSEDHSHCEDLLNELGARASSAETRLHSVRLFIDTPHPHWGQGEVLDGVREILDGVVERRGRFCYAELLRADGHIHRCEADAEHTGPHYSDSVPDNLGARARTEWSE
jgi:hypothetical protein